MDTATPRAPGQRDRLVGRRRELDALRGWLDAARDGDGRLVLCIGEPGIGKTRLAQELAGAALAAGTSVAWGRCLEGRGAPAFWPWRQVLTTLGHDAAAVLAGDPSSADERLRVFDAVASALRAAAERAGAVVVLDDLHWADEPSLLLLRHLADLLAASRLLVLTAFRDVEPAGALPRVVPDLLRSPRVEVIELRGFGVDEVLEQLSRTSDATVADARAVLDLTGGNPLFVREIARAKADGSWRQDRPPRTVLDLVRARLDRVSPDCRGLVQAAAVAGRDVALPVVAAALDRPVDACLPLLDEAVAHGLLDRTGTRGAHRFVHALTRDAVEASLSTAGRASLHRAVAEAKERYYAGDLSEHAADIARHWAELTPYGEGARARAWALRAADEAVRRLAYEEGVRLYRTALELDAAPLPPEELLRVLVDLGRAARAAGDLARSVEAAVAAADAARAAQRPAGVAEAALVLEAVPDNRVNAVAKQLCEQALSGLDTGAEPGDASLRARLLALRSHLAFYEGDQDGVDALSSAALARARTSGDDSALIEALQARQEACPGPAGREERLALAAEMLALAGRTGSARAAMWGHLWRIEGLVESGRLADAADELGPLQVATDRVGGPLSAWHLDRVSACIAQAQGRFADAMALGRRAFDRMHPIEPAPATGAYFALQCALAGHVGVTDDALAFAGETFDPPPRFRTMARLSRALLLLRAGRPEEAAASYGQAGPIDGWSLPAFFVVPGYVYGALAAAGLGRPDDVAALLGLLEPFRGEHAVGGAVAYLGPVELALGRGALALGRLDRAVQDLELAAERAERAGAPAFVAEARHHLAIALTRRGSAGDQERAEAAARAADHLVRALGMTACAGPAVRPARVRPDRRAALSRRENEVADLVASGLTNRQVAERLVISERTAENHVQHILTKLGLTSRSQVTAWVLRGADE